MNKIASCFSNALPNYAPEIITPYFHIASSHNCLGKKFQGQISTFFSMRVFNSHLFASLQ